MRTLVLLLISCSYFSVIAGSHSDDTLAKKTSSTAVFSGIETRSLCKNVIGMMNPATMCSENYILDRSLYLLKVDTLPQVKFWRDIMKLHQDSAIISFAHNRAQIAK